ncbi:ABC transporter ATP-binding protein [Variovorax sp. HJSM1_2]|uniref:ABC transporter ATP-binding protein n=1 Tax=Variovorax sp. HJSM1_2 TaxID=3366263 RepID=UPI003BDCDF1B
MTRPHQSSAPLLLVENLQVALPTPHGLVPAIRNIHLRLERGQTLGVIGESGSGKSITMLALMGLLPEQAQVSGSVKLNGQEMVGASDATFCGIRGNRVGMVFQDPMSALNPVQTIGRQVAEPLRLHRGLSRNAARAEAVALLTRVGIADAARRAEAYPHQFSGGQRQRITIAMALACGPDLLIADEPTTALDATLQLQILQLLRELVAERGMALILISHDLGVIAQNVDQMLVMYGGSIVERGPTAAVFQHMAHPYTRGLFAARPMIGLRAEGQRPRLPTITGHVPELQDIPPGCPFAGRCAWTEASCASTTPPALAVPVHSSGAAHTASCQPHVLRQLEATA